MHLSSSLLALFVSFVFTAAAQDPIPANTWVRLAQDPQGARRASAIRYAGEGDAFILWGFMGHPTEDYGNPEQPWDGNREYDVVAFDLQSRQWRSHLPTAKQSEWSKQPPPVHECNSYYGITTGSYRPELKLREGVLRPDLNIVFDQVAYDSKRARMVYFTGGRTFAMTSAPARGQTPPRIRQRPRPSVSPPSPTIPSTTKSCSPAAAMSPKRTRKAGLPVTPAPGSSTVPAPVGARFRLRYNRRLA